MRGYGVIQHTLLICARVQALASALVATNGAPNEDAIYATLIATLEDLGPA